MKQYLLLLFCSLAFPTLYAQSLETGSFTSLGNESVNNADIQLTAICGQPFDITEGSDCLAYGFTEVVATANEATEITGISLDKNKASIETGGSLQLTATLSPVTASNLVVNWHSSNPLVATVNDGKVTAINTGETTITVTSASGMRAAECALTVTRTPEPVPVPVAGISLDQVAVALDVHTTIQLIATILPANADNKTVIWKSSDERVAAVDRGTVTALASGTATIRATSQDGTYTAECIVTVKSTDTAIDKVESGNKVYPTAVENYLYIDLQQAQTIYIVSVSGKICEVVQGKTGHNTLSLQKYPSGMYLVRLNNETVKVIKR